MTKIQISPEDVRSKGNDIIRRKGDMDQAITSAKSLVNQLRSEFLGNLANSIYGEWDALVPQLQKAEEAFQSAGDLLIKAANAFEQVDNTKIS
jgi:WXG100 family type VII secretion target